MSAALLLAVTAAYAGIACSEAIKGNWSMTTVFAGYALANVGLIAAL
jgi:hypothetical protein